MEHLVTTGGIIGGPPMATAKAADATSVVHRWDSGGSSATTGGLRLVSNPGMLLPKSFEADFWKLVFEN